MSPEPLLLVERDEPIAVVLLNRPKQLNALSDGLMEELVGTLTELDADPAIRCIVLGIERAFAAGADIEELAHVGDRALLRAASSAGMRSARCGRRSSPRSRFLPRRRLRAGDDV